MSDQAGDLYDRVGPVLQTGAIGAAIVAAIRDLNPDVIVLDRGAYLRVMVPRRCFVTRAAIEKHLGRAFRFPAFKGALQLGQEDAVWQFAGTFQK